MGELSCVSGAEINDCMPLFPSPNDPVCDSIDEDCDGVADEDFASSCTQSGFTTCVLGQVEEQSCDDSNVCTGDGCSAGACVHVATTCDDSNPCTVDSCDGVMGGCAAVPQTGLACSDGDLCTAADACSEAGTCLGGASLNPDDANPCTDDSCDPLSGVQNSVAVGRVCSDGNACTSGDACSAGGTCAPTGTLQCDDGLFCTGAETCNPSTGCLSGVPPVLTDGVVCTTDGCDESGDAVTHTPNDAVCDDANSCTTNTCDPEADCQSTLLPDGTACDRGGPDTEHVLCEAGVCVPELLSDIERVSIGWTSGGASIQGNGHSWSRRFGSSGDGSIVAFESFASNFVFDDTNADRDVFIYELHTDTLTMSSRSHTGGIANGGSRFASISPDGLFIAYHSSASNLVPGDTNGFLDSFVYDRQSGVTERVSVSSDEVQANNECVLPSISADGRFVAMLCAASNMVPGDTNGQQDIIVRDRLLGVTERASVSSTGAQGNGFVDFADISADGRHVVFMSKSTNLVPGDTNGVQDTFVRDRILGTTTRLSVSSSGVQSNADSFRAVLSADGRYVVFTTAASNLVAEVTSGVHDVYVHDSQTATTSLVSRTWNGAVANAGSFQPVISGDGRYVVFQTQATNMVAGDTNGFSDVFVHDLLTGASAPVSITASGAPANHHTFEASISDDGRRIAFIATASNLVASDTNGFDDVYSAPNPLW